MKQKDLTKQELRVLLLVAKGLKNKEISKLLYISISTTKTYLENIFHKLGVKNRIQAVIKGLYNGLISIEDANNT